jgi:YVTN family beta-propeller protein
MTPEVASHALPSVVVSSGIVRYLWPLERSVATRYVSGAVMPRELSSFLRIAILTGLCALAILPFLALGGLERLAPMAQTQDSEGGTVVATVPVGRQPSGVAYDSLTGFVYVTNFGSNNVSVISETTVIANVTVGKSPFGISYDSGNGLIYVANGDSGSVSVIDGTRVVGTVLVGGAPIGVAYNSGNGNVYVTNIGPGIGPGIVPGTVNVISGTTVVGIISVGNHPVGVGYDSGNGYMYVTNEPDNTVSVINGTAIVGAIKAGGAPVGVGYDSGNGYVYVTNTGSASVSVISGTTVLETVPVGINPFAAEYDSGNGYVYVTNSGSGSVSVMNGTMTVANITVGNNPVGAAYDSGNGYVYVANSLSDTVSVISTATSVPFDYSLSNSDPVSIQQGMSGSVTITATLTSNTRQRPVTLSCLDSSLPSGISCTSFTVNPVTLSSPGGTSDLKITVASSVAAGSYGFQVTGSPLGATTTPTTVSVSVTGPPSPTLEYTLSVNPTIATIVVGSSTSATVTATLTSSTAQPVILLLSVSPNPRMCQLGSGSSPCGIFNFSPTSIEPTTTGATSSLTISTTTTVPPGTYTLTITASPPGSSSSSATLTLFITPRSVSAVTCGRGLFCVVQSNATLSRISFAGITVHVEADGPSGAHGYVNATVPRSEIGNTNQIKVFVDNSQLDKSALMITSNSSGYFVYFTFTFHSPVLIDIQLGTPQNGNQILGVDPTIVYALAGVVLVLLVGASVAYRTSKHRQRTVSIPH